MVRLLIILLVMLLPLRGWSAERMATQMLLSQAAVQVAGEPIEMAGMPADCPMLAQAAPETDKSPAPAKSHVGCQTCQLCMALAALSPAPPPLLSYERQIRPVPAKASFISADLSRQVKPPIL